MSRRGWPHVDDPIAVGTRLKEARLAAGFSQRELSFPGCTAVYICRIERGDRVPSLQVLRELARRVGVDENYLATGASGAAADRVLEADVALRLGHLELAAQLYAQLLEGKPDAIVRACALGGLGRIDLQAGRVDEAMGRLDEAREVLGDAIVEHVGILDALARTRAMRGEHEPAVDLLRHALDLATACGDKQAEARIRVLLASALVESGNLPSARELLGRSVADAPGLTDPSRQARLYWAQSRLRSSEQNAEAAARYARLALASVELADNVESAAQAHRLLAYVELERGNADEALELYERAAEIVADRDPELLRDVYGRMAELLEADGRKDEALELLKRAVGVQSQARGTV